MFVHKSNFLMRTAYPKLIWKMPVSEKKIYLTFDDGPIPEVTEFVLETLEKYKAQASFFCIGDNIYKHPTIFKKLLAAGHSIGNHTYNHLNGWKTENESYFRNIENCTKIINTYQSIRALSPKKTLFRPPYGRIKRVQIKNLIPDYQIIMWDVLSGDFSSKLSPEIVLKKTIQHSRNGSIVLFHDSLKAEKNMSYALPRFLEHFGSQGFTFETL